MRFIKGLALFVFLVGFALAGSYTIAGPLKGPYPVEYIYDGDTIRVGGEKVRLVLIDTPESSENQRTADRNELILGRKAKVFTENLIQRAGGKVYLEVAPESKDRYGRTLAYVYLPYLEGTTPWIYQNQRYTSLNYELVRQGWAEGFVVGSKNTRYLDAYREAQDYAKRLSLGIWAVYQQVETAAKSLPVRIKCVVYNPSGTDAGKEEIWLEILRPVDLTGWAVGDDDGFRIALAGHAEPGVFVVRNPGRPQLSNKGDTVLLWHNSEVVDRFTYQGQRGQERACR